MAFEVKELEAAGLEEYRVYVTDGKDEFVVERACAQRLCDLLNGEAKPVRIKRTVTK